jgi:nucleoside-diphosphate-sugar epimerase
MASAGQSRSSGSAHHADEKARRVALVAGANGLIGRHLIVHLVRRGWDVIALSRKPSAGIAVRTVAVDLADAADARAKAAALSGVTHVFYCARADHPEGVPESESLNAAMLRNLIDAVEPVAPRLAHVNLVHGTKYYGHHLGPCEVPAVEGGPRGKGGTFYFAQQDFVTERAAARGWSWSIVRPHAFCYTEMDSPRSLVLVIAVLAAIQRELGEPLFYPGTAKSHEAVTQFTDLGLLTRGIEWMASAPECASQAFNVVNGDYPKWSALWPQLAALLGLEAAPPRALSLPQYMADKGPVWDAVVKKHGLEPKGLDRIVLWRYADYVFAPQWDIMSSMEKARRFGFHERVDTREMFSRLFEGYRAQRAIP